MNARLRFLLVAILPGLVATAMPARAALPTLEPPALLCRAHNSGAYHLPDGVFFSGAPALNEMGKAALFLSVVGADTNGVFYLDAAAGEIIQEGPDGASVGGAGVSLNNAGQVVFSQFASGQDGVWLWQPGKAAALLTTLPTGATVWASPHIDEAGIVAFSAGIGGHRVFASWNNSQVAIHAAEAGFDAGSPYSVLFSPATNDQRQMAAKARLGADGQNGENRPDQIRIFASDGSSSLIAEDTESNAAAPFTRFDNSVSLNDQGWVAFTAQGTDGRRGVYFSNGVTTLPIAIDDDLVVTEISTFSPVANNSGIVAFLGRNNAGVETIFVGDGTVLMEAIHELDPVTTDLGQAQLESTFPGAPVLGPPAIDQHGDISFSSIVTPAGDDSTYWGVGLFVMRAALFADGLESGDTLAWSATIP